MDGNRELQNSNNSHRKVVAVAAGEAHTLALAGDGRVYSWGRGMFGRLGTGSESDEMVPVQVKFEPLSEKEETQVAKKQQKQPVKFVGVAAGAYHSLALSDDGLVWCWGYNIYGQLGVSGENSVLPRLMDRFVELGSPEEQSGGSETGRGSPLKVCTVKAGGMMSLAIDNLGGLWMWGNCPRQDGGSEGGFSFGSSCTPTPVWDFNGRTVVKVACGNEHVVALVSAGEIYNSKDLVCYSWGSNNHGQLGLGDTESRALPEIVKTFNQNLTWAAYEVACGAFHTALLAQKKRPNDTLGSVCFTFGLGKNGQLGHGTTQSELKPKPVKELPEHACLISVDCGLFHTSVVSSAGDVWSWGMERGLGLCPGASFSGMDSGDAILPLLISGNAPFQDPIQVACGAAHTLLVANNGHKLWSWGRGRSGVLGTSKTVDYYTPAIMLWPPLTEDFNQQDLDPVNEADNPDTKSPEESVETDKKLASAMEEMKVLQSKLTAMEQYASLLHTLIFGKPFTEQDIPTSSKNLSPLDIAKEWENMLESADRRELISFEHFYRNMLGGVKDKLMKRRIQEIIKECLPSSSAQL